MCKYISNTRPGHENLLTDLGDCEEVIRATYTWAGTAATDARRVGGEPTQHSMSGTHTCAGNSDSCRG